LENRIVGERFLRLLAHASTFVAIFLLNRLTPVFNYDNYIYATGVRSISDVFVRQYQQWLTWCGRCVPHFFVHLFMMFDKIWFDLCNSLIYVAFIHLLCRHAVGGGRKITLQMYLLMNILLWYFMRSWGSCILWLDGGCNYLWTATICLIFLLPYRRLLTEAAYRHDWAAGWMLPLGILVGWSNENTGAAILVGVCLYVWHKRRRKMFLEVWEWLGICGFLLGYAILIAAPGNYLRAGAPPSSFWIFHGLQHNFLVCLKMLDRAGRAVACCAILAFLYRRRREVRASYAAMGYLFLALVSHFSMVASPEYGGRCTMPTVYFGIIALGHLVGNLDFSGRTVIDKLIKILCLGWILHFPVSFYNAVVDALATKTNREKILMHILAEKAGGNLDVVTEQPSSPKDMHTGDYLCCPISQDPNNWVNRAYSNYFGLRSLRVADEKSP
jgi:hypothetical protein